MASTSTKVIGVRLPLNEYMDILQSASDAKMTISDYAFQILYRNKYKISAVNDKQIVVDKDYYETLKRKADSNKATDDIYAQKLSKYAGLMNQVSRVFNRLKLIPGTAEEMRELAEIIELVKKL